jgi:hypothetical protein
MASTNDRETAREKLQKIGNRFASFCYFVLGWLAYSCYIISRKTLIVLGFYGGLALALYNFKNSPFWEPFWAIELIIPYILILTSATLMVFIYHKWDDFSTSPIILKNYFFGVLFILFNYHYQHIFQSNVCRYLLIAIGVVFIIQVVASRYKNRQKKYVGAHRDHIAYRPANFIFREWWVDGSDILAWTKDDKPPKGDHCGFAQDDYFDFTVKARTIADRLIKNFDANEDAAICLCGQYGFGKTTITELVESVVMFEKKRKNIIFVRANCWGYDNTQSVQEYIIKKIIDGMTEAGLDTDHLVGIPKQYVRALTEKHTIFDTIVTFLHEERIPEKVLSVIEKTLCYEKKRLVLVLEDLDRNENDDFQLDKVAATLRRLRETKHISFIITGFYRWNDKEDKRIDFAKICDYITETPKLSDQNKIACLMNLVAHHNENVIKPQTNQDNPTFIDQSEPHWNALINLIDTPRKLKTIIRDLDAVWSEGKLRGECDYVELFALTVLRNGDDPVFDLIEQNLSELRNQYGQVREESIKTIETYNKRHTEQYTQILDWLFIQDQESLPQDLSPPKIARRICKKSLVSYMDNAGNRDFMENVDYFKRIVTERVPKWESDQMQLQAIEDWNSNNDKKELLIDTMIVMSRHNDLYERWFDTIKNPNELTEKIIIKLFNAKTEEETGYRPLESGDFLLEFLSKQCVISKDVWLHILSSEDLSKKLFRNLEFASNFYSYFGRCHKKNDNSGYYGCPIDHFEEIRTRFIDRCKTIYTTPKSIIDACSVDHKPLRDKLYRLIDLTCAKNEPSLSLEQEPNLDRAVDWHWLAPILEEGLCADYKETRKIIFEIIVPIDETQRKIFENIFLDHSQSVLEKLRTVYSEQQ